MTASDHLSGDQFTRARDEVEPSVWWRGQTAPHEGTHIEFADESGIRKVPMAGRKLVSMPVQHLRAGMIARPSWRKSMPFERVAATPKVDTDHPNHHFDPDDPGHIDTALHYPVPYARKFGPHEVENSQYHVLARKKRK